MEQKVKTRTGIGIIVGVVLAIGCLIANKSARRQVLTTTKKTNEGIRDAATFLQENREEIISQIKRVSSELSQLSQSANQDLKTIAERASHLKDTTSELAETTKEATEDLKELKEEENEGNYIEPGQFEPSGDPSVEKKA
ncbi:hypothetical protein [Salsuginibacillus kocurii]|uniref:hypothetical protein n=1 Tax=Salsuginibacillus kocurii TaxID=427078 RepID=UPI00035D9ECC|nr:hypothetical protein [Salsuginibacillus kocurii]